MNSDVSVRFKFAWTNITWPYNVSRDLTIKELYDFIIDRIKHSSENSTHDIFIGDRHLHELSLNDFELIEISRRENGIALEHFRYHNMILNETCIEDISSETRWNICGNKILEDYFSLSDNNISEIFLYLRILRQPISLVVQDITTENNDTICPICLENNCQTTRFNCQHRFCHDCIDNWVSICNRNNNIPSCPVCRNSMLREERYIIPTVIRSLSNTNDILLDLTPRGRHRNPYDDRVIRDNLPNNGSEELNYQVDNLYNIDNLNDNNVNMINNYLNAMYSDNHITLPDNSNLSNVTYDQNHNISHLQDNNYNNLTNFSLSWTTSIGNSIFNDTETNTYLINNYY